MESDEDAMDLEDLPDMNFEAPAPAAFAMDAVDPLDGLYDDAPPEDGTVDRRPLPRDWDSVLRARVPKRRRPTEYAEARADETAEPFAKMPRMDMEEVLRRLHLNSENPEFTVEERHRARIEFYRVMRENGYHHQAELDEANRPFESASLQELQHRINNYDLPQELRNQAREQLYRLMRDLGYYQFRIPWRPGAGAAERITANSARSHPLLGEPLLLDVMEFPNWIPGEAGPRSMPGDALGTHRRLAIYPTLVVDLIDEGFISENHNKRRLTVHLPNMEWAAEIQEFARKLGARNVAEEFKLSDRGQCTDLVHFLQWLVGQTCYSTLRSSQHGYWYYQEFKSLEVKSGDSFIHRINPFGIGHLEYLKYLFQRHLLDLHFKECKPKEYETLQETWMGAMQSLENVQMDRERAVWYDTNFPCTSWMPIPVKQLLTALARDCIEEDTGRLHWHPSWSALDYCLLMGEWYLTAS